MPKDANPPYGKRVTVKRHTHGDVVHPAAVYPGLVGTIPPKDQWNNAQKHAWRRGRRCPVNFGNRGTVVMHESSF